ESAMCGCKELRERCCWCGGVAVLRTAVWRELRWPRLAAGASMLRCGSNAAIGGLAFGWHPFDFSSRLRASRHFGQILRSADIKADSCDGRGVFRAETLERPMFSGVRGENLARSRSSPTA